MNAHFVVIRRDECPNAAWGHAAYSWRDRGGDYEDEKEDEDDRGGLGQNALATTRLTLANDRVCRMIHPA
jgi:hypothetical protein